MMDICIRIGSLEFVSELGATHIQVPYIGMAWIVHQDWQFGWKSWKLINI
jgi:hypothetical protein